MVIESPSPSDRPGRKRGPYAKSSETRERLLAAAFEVAGEVGLHRTSVAAIAKRAGVAVGNLHYHFGSRDDLLREVMRWVLAELIGEMRDATATCSNFLAWEEAAVRTYLEFVHRNPTYVRLAEEARLHQPEIYRDGMKLWLNLLRYSIEQAIERGELHPMNDDEVVTLAYLLLGTRYFLDQMIAGANGQPYPGDETVVAIYLDLIRHGILKETP